MPISSQARLPTYYVGRQMKYVLLLVHTLKPQARCAFYARAAHSKPQKPTTLFCRTRGLYSEVEAVDGIASRGSKNSFAENVCVK